jgi:hypothetical protein
MASAWRVKTTRNRADFTDFTKRFRVYDIADQDGIAAWMRTEFPGIFFILKGKMIYWSNCCK